MSKPEVQRLVVYALTLITIAALSGALALALMGRPVGEIGGFAGTGLGALCALLVRISGGKEEG